MMLALRELEALAGLRTTRLLAFDLARVAREQAEVTQLPLVRLVDLDERTRDREPQRARLTGHPATVQVCAHVVPAERVGGRERLLDRRHQRRPRKVVTERAPVDVPLAGTRLDVHAAHRFLAAPDGMDGGIRHYFDSLFTLR